MNKNEDQIQQLLEKGQFLIKYAKKYTDFYKTIPEDHKTLIEKQVKRNSIVLQQVLYTSESLLILQSLFSTDKREACFRSILDKEHPGKRKYEKLQTEYLDTPLPGFRKKIIAHKDRNNIGDTITSYLNPIQEKWLDKADYFYTELNYLLRDNFDIIVGDVFESWYKKTFDNIYNLIKDAEQNI